MNLSHPMPTSSPEKADAERIGRLLDAVAVAAFIHTTRQSELKLIHGLSRMVAIVSVFVALQLIESASNAWAWWSCFIAFSVLILELAFNPSQRAIWHCVRASRLDEVGSYMSDQTIPSDETALFTWWQEKAKKAGLNDSEISDV